MAGLRTRSLKVASSRWISAVLLAASGIMLPGSPADFGKLVADETEKWGKVIRFAGIKAE